MSLEKHTYEAVVRLFTLAGCLPYRLAQSRATRQSPGLPDLFVFGPGQRFAWVEVKRPGGRLRPEQRLFRERCQQRHIAHVVGGVDEVQQLLTEWGLLQHGVLVPPRKAV